MRKTFRYALLSLRDLAISVGPFAALAVTLLAPACGWLDRNPPKCAARQHPAGAQETTGSKSF